MLRNTIQHQLYYEQQGRNELSKLLSFLRIPVYTLLIFTTVEAIRNLLFPQYEFFLSFMFWAVCIILIFYWMPNKKEYVEWVKKHSTF